MASKIRGITVTLYDEYISGEDGFGDPVIGYKPVEIPNVLVAPSSQTEILETVNLYGSKAVYTLAIPKDDEHSWANKKVDFFGESWRVFGIPVKGIDDLIPGPWNKKVMVERYE